MSFKTKLVGGTTWITLAEALILPTGFLTLTFLTRELGTEGYGLFALAASLVAWIEWGLNSVFSRATIKFVSESDRIETISTAVLRAQLGCGILAALIVVVLAPAIAAALNEAALTPLLRLFALEIPLVNLAQAHQNILAGTGKFGARALATAVRWTMRLLFIVALVSMGFSISGAIIGSLAAMLADIVICRCFIRPSLFSPSDFPLSALAGYALPLFLAALSTRLYVKLDLFALKALGGTAEQAGIYAVAQNLALFGGVMSPALAPVLIATVSQLLSRGERGAVRSLCRSAMRVVLLHLPFVGLLVGAAGEIVPWLFGQPFAAAAPLFSLLLLATVAAVMVAVTSAILVASDRPVWAAVITVPMPFVALLGHWLLIPRFGAVGAALATLLVALLGAISGVVGVRIRWRVWPAAMTLLRSSAIAFAIGIASIYWRVSGSLLLLKLPVLSVSAVLLLFLFGEVSAEDKMVIRKHFNKFIGRTSAP